jgi:hypothetical protein
MDRNLAHYPAECGFAVHGRHNMIQPRQWFRLLRPGRSGKDMFVHITAMGDARLEYMNDD